MLLHINIKKVYYSNLRAMGYFITFILNFCFKASVIESWTEPKVFNSFRKKARSQMFDRVPKCSSEYHIINRDVFISQSNLYDRVFCENSQPLSAVNNFCKKALSQVFDWVLNTPLFYYMAFRGAFPTLSNIYN